MTNPISPQSICTAAAGYNVLQDVSFSSQAQNELLLFIKPEVFLGSKSEQIRRVELILQKLEDFEITVTGVVSVDGPTLGDNQVMDRHYGYINRMSRSASTSFSEEDRSAIHGLLGTSPDMPILGGHEVMEQYSKLTSQSLDDIWATKKSKKLRSGLYVEGYEIDGSSMVIVNGFHPLQLDHFTGGDRRIVLMVLSSNLPWARLRSHMLGDTFPENADRNSVRGEFSENPEKFGFDSVTIANNCAHMSAGPFEAAFEFQNFLGTDPDFEKLYSESSLVKCAVENGIAIKPLKEIIKSGGSANPSLSLSESLFDATEEFDTYSSVEVLRQSL